jgi:hypothetical protein
LRDFFEVLGRVGEIQPPSGLVDSVMARIPRRLAPRSRWRQPFWRSGVIAADSVETRDASPGKTARGHRISRAAQNTRELTMSEQKKGVYRQHQRQGCHRRRCCCGRGDRDIGN